MALFSASPSPEIRQAQQPDSLRHRRNIIVITSIGYLERSIQAMESYRADAVVEYNPSAAQAYDEPATPTPEPGSVTALQDYYREKARIAREADGLMPAYAMSEDVAQSMQEIYGKQVIQASASAEKNVEVAHHGTSSAVSEISSASHTSTVVPLTERIVAANPDIAVRSERPAA